MSSHTRSGFALKHGFSTQYFPTMRASLMSLRFSSLKTISPVSVSWMLRLLTMERAESRSDMRSSNALNFSYLLRLLCRCAKLVNSHSMAGIDLTALFCAGITRLVCITRLIYKTLHIHMPVVCFKSYLKHIQAYCKHIDA